MTEQLDDADDTIRQDLGYFGNIWVKSHYLKSKGDSNGGGHTHKFDHVTLLIRGKVKVEVEGQRPKLFSAPTFIIIPKENKHRFTALEDNTVYYCVFALRDIDGEVTELYDERNSPYWSGISRVKPPATQEELEKLDKDTTKY